MNSNILEIINQDFKQSERAFVIDELSTITVNHVMAESEINLNNTRLAILKLAKGNIQDVSEFTKAAKIDFRDVIMWSMQESKNDNE
jgi:hypothetical protein